MKHCLFGDDEGLPLEDIAEEEELAEAKANGEVGEEDEMEDFIVDEEFDATGVPALGVSSSSLHEADEIFGDVDELLLLHKQGSDSNERRIYEESTGSPPLDGISIDYESTWIYNQLRSGTIPLYSKPGLRLGSSISRDDIIRFLDLHHVQKFLLLLCIEKMSAKTY
ncbi:unnamed protein product [Prunus brigantina]